MNQTVDKSSNQKPSKKLINTIICYLSKKIPKVIPTKVLDLEQAVTNRLQSNGPRKPGGFVLNHPVKRLKKSID